MAARYNGFDELTEPFRRNRRLLHLSNLHFRRSRTELEAALNSMLNTQESGIALHFFWPPVPQDILQSRGRNAHLGWVLVGFDDRRQRNTVLEALHPRGGSSIR